MTGDIDIPDGAEVTFRMVPEKFVISFHDPDSKELGRLWENDDGELQFLGNLHESASTFFGAVVECNSKRIKELTNE